MCQHGTKSGPERYLSVEEEEELTNFLVRTACIGYPRSKKQVLAIVQQCMDSKGMNKTVSDGWWDRYKERRKELTLRTAIPLSFVRAMASDRDTIDRYYDVLESNLLENDLIHKPTLIINCDKTGMPLSLKPPKVVQTVGKRNRNCVTSDSKSQLTILACVSCKCSWLTNSSSCYIQWENLKSIVRKG